MPVIHVNVKNKIATCSLRDPIVVCNNTDYTVKFTFDGEWDGVTAKVARFIWNGKHSDVNIIDNKCTMPVIDNATECTIGVYGGNLSTSTPAKLLCRLSILNGQSAESSDMRLRKLIDGTLTEVTPEILHGVTEINAYMFAYQQNLEKVEIPASVTTLHDNAFSYCDKLKTIILPPNIAAADDTYSLFDGTTPEKLVIPGNMCQYFYNFDNLTSVVINGSADIPEGVFGGANYLVSVEIGNDVKKIEANAFNGNDALSSVKIGKSVENIGEGAFGNCLSLTTINIDPENTHYHVVNGCLIEISTKTIIACTSTATIPTDGSVTAIGAGVFANRDYIVSIPEGITRVGESAFADCTNLTSIPSTLTTIGQSSFSGCTALTSVTANIANVPGYAFNGCTGLTSVSGIGNVEADGFNGCAKLASVHFSANATSINTNGFKGCYGLSEITIDEQNATYEVRDGCLIEKALSGYTRKVILGASTCNLTGEIVPLVTYTLNIPEYAFRGHTELTSIEIHNYVFQPEVRAFANCTNLATVMLPPDHRADLSQRVFQNCTALKSVFNVSQMTGDLFYGCTSLEKVTFLDLFNYGFNNAFKTCSAMKVYDFRHNSHITSLTIISDFGHAPGCKIVVPDALYEDWKKATNWAALTDVVWVKASEYVEE